jgi:hypothetical protein
MAWFDAAIPGSMTFSGNQVLNWQDRRGGFYKSFMNDLDRAPSLVQNVVSGRPALFFDDINDGMETNISMGDEYTIFLIYNKQKTSIDTTRVIQ